MSKSFYNLLREKNKLEKGSIKTSQLRNVWSSEREKLLEEYKKTMEDLKVIQQCFDLELVSELSDKAEL